MDDSESNIVHLQIKPYRLPQLPVADCTNIQPKSMVMLLISALVLGLATPFNPRQRLNQVSSHALSVAIGDIVPKLPDFSVKPVALLPYYGATPPIPQRPKLAFVNPDITDLPPRQPPAWLQEQLVALRLKPRA